ncbi:MAG: hypothetical protein WAK57_07215 [Desulfobacterales bacterium]
MKRYKIKSLSWAVICITGLWFLFAANAMADDDHGFRRHFEREDHHRIPFWGSDNEGSETTGEIAAWLLLVANLPVALSLLVKGTNRFAPLGTELKKTLANLNRMQKKALMWLHYYLNLGILGIALWHWLSSRCKSSALPELGLMMMVTVIALGFLIKFKLCPKALRTYAYQIHTQPVIFIAMFMVLTVGHLIVD